MINIIEKYSPNIRWGKQAVELVLKQWDYSAVRVVEVGGNCRGFDVIECAITMLYDVFATREPSRFPSRYPRPAIDCSAKMMPMPARIGLKT